MRYVFYIFAIICSIGCKQTKSKFKSEERQKNNINAVVSGATQSETDSIIETKQELTVFIPKNFVIVDTITGDLNKDNRVDKVLLIKAADKRRIVHDEYSGEPADRNRRGLIVLFNQGNHYKKILENDTCFSSENEPGGIYYAPELFIEINKNKLSFNYAHGRYGYWQYIFKYQNNDFELIGYESSANHGPVVNRETSINFITKERVIRTNTNEEAEGGDEVFETKKERIKLKKLIKLSQVQDFDTFYIGDYFE